MNHSGGELGSYKKLTLFKQRFDSRVGFFYPILSENMMESKIQATLCPTSKDWDELTFDLYYWREVPAAEYDDWVDRCEALDQKIETFIAGAGYVLGTITYWRDRTLEFQLHELTDDRLYGLQEQLVDEFRDWRIAIMVWLELDKPLEDYPNINESEHLGTVLIGRDFFIVSGGLADYFPRALPAD